MRQPVIGLKAEEAAPDGDAASEPEPVEETAADLDTPATEEPISETAESSDEAAAVEDGKTAGALVGGRGKLVAAGLALLVLVAAGLGAWGYRGYGAKLFGSVETAESDKQ